MNQPTILICEPEEMVRGKLTELLLEKKELDFRVLGFTDDEALKVHYRGEHIDVVLVAQHLYQAVEDLITCDCMIVLQETEEAPPVLHTIQKYQSAGQIVREICEIYAACDQVAGKAQESERTVQLIGFYTPVHGLGQTGTALTLGSLMAESGRVLYVNLEYYAGLGDLIEDPPKGTLTDLLYFYECAPQKMAYRMESIVGHLGNLDVILPGDLHSDYKTMPKEAWLDFIECLGRECGYQCVILDLSDEVESLPQLLEGCGRAIVLRGDTQIGEAKLREYQQREKEAGREELLEHLEYWSLPKLPDRGFLELLQTYAWKEAVRDAWAGGAK